MNLHVYVCIQVAIDEEALDQQLLSTGITDRNITDYLGLVEQRIDELIQVRLSLSSFSFFWEEGLVLLLDQCLLPPHIFFYCVNVDVQGCQSPSDSTGGFCAHSPCRFPGGQGQQRHQRHAQFEQSALPR